MAKERRKRIGFALLATAGVALLLAGCRREAARDPAQHLAAGWSWYCQGDFSLAEKEFGAALILVPTNCPLRQQVFHALATTWDLRRPGEDPARAEQCYREAIALAPTNDLSAWCWLALARLKSQPQGGEPAFLKMRVEAYQQVIDRFPFHLAGEEAFLHQQSALLEKPDPGAARRVLTALGQFIADHPQSPWRSQAWRLVGHCCDVLGLREDRLAAALQEWKTQEVDPHNPLSDLSSTYWSIATIAEFDVGDFAGARECYRRLITEYPTDQKVFLARQELKRMDEVEAGMRSAKGPERSRRAEQKGGGP